MSSNLLPVTVWLENDTAAIILLHCVCFVLDSFQRNDNLFSDSAVGPELWPVTPQLEDALQRSFEAEFSLFKFTVRSACS